MSEAAKELIAGGPGKAELGEIPLILDDSTVPILRRNARVLVSVNSSAIHLKATPEWDGSLESLVSGAGDAEVYELDLTTRDRVQSVRFNSKENRVIVYHEDPFGVEDKFETVFTSARAYWIKALCKMLKDRFGVTIEEEPEKDQEGDWP